MLTTYIITGTNTNIIWQFKYRLDGLLYEFKLMQGDLDAKQINWLFIKGNFPYQEKQIKAWTAIKNFKIEVGQPDLSFDNFWNTYNNKVGKRKMAENTWNRMSKADQLNVFINLPKYKNYLKYYPNQQMMYPTTYLNQEAYKNEWKV